MDKIEINRKNAELEFIVSDHASLRINQRSIDKGTLKVVLSFGRINRSCGVNFYVLGKRDSGHLQALGIKVQSLENTQVVVD